MSRIGKKPIPIPEKTEVTVSGRTVTVNGPLGVLARQFSPAVSIAVADRFVTLTPLAGNADAKVRWGTYASHIANMIEGVNSAFHKKLLIEGIGFKAEVKGANLVLSLGFSHPVIIAIPKELKVVGEKGTLVISGPDKELVGQFAAVVRDQKPPEPYKGKGIRYDNEIIRRKQGKKTA